MEQPRPTNGEKPATQKDLSILAGEMTTRFGNVENRLDAIENRLGGMGKRLNGMDERLTNLEQGQQSLLRLVESIDDQLRSWRHIPATVERIHRKVFPRG